MSYFKNFPIFNYPYGGKLVEGDKITRVECTDIMVRYRIRPEILDNPFAIYSYQWKDSDRPDVVAHRYYGSYEYTWLVMYSGNIFDWLHELPMNKTAFENYLQDTYGQPGYELASVIHHYEDGDGAIIDLNTYTNIVDAGKKAVSVYDYEFDANENRRSVKLISKEYLTQIRNEFDKALTDLKENRRTTKGEVIQ